MGAVRDLGSSITASFLSALGLLISFVPKLLGCIAILIIGLIVSSLLARAVVLLLKRCHFDHFSDRVGLTRLSQRAGVNLDAAHILGRVVYWFVFLIFLIPALNTLGLTTFTSILDQIIGYIPNVFVAILVLFLGMLLAHFVADIVRGATAGSNIASPTLLANIARFAIIAFSALIALDQLAIAPALVDTLFSAVVGALALAVGLAFGLGGRDAAKRFLERRTAETPPFTPQEAQISPADAVPVDVRERFNETPTVDKMPPHQSFGSQPVR